MTLKQALHTPEGWKYYQGEIQTDKERIKTLQRMGYILTKQAWYQQKRRFLEGKAVRPSTKEKILKNFMKVTWKKH